MLLLNGSDVRELFPMREAIEVDKKAFLLHSTGETEVLLRSGFEMEDGVVLFMPAYVKGDVEQVGIKIASVFPGNFAKNIPVIPAQMLLVDSGTGEVQAIMNGAEITRIRTGAISGAATDLLARKNSTTAAIFGTGGQASSQLEALFCVRPIKEVRVFDAEVARIAPFVKRNLALAERHGAVIRAAKSPDEAIDGADVITTVTTSRKPIFNGRSVAKGTHVNGIGSYTPTARELDERLLLRARVFVDARESVHTDPGDFFTTAAAGLYDSDEIAGELGDVIAGRLPGRTSDDEITVLKTVGYAVLDVVAAHHIYINALSKGVGTRIEL
jgi:ornithine cyclodeaminase